MCRSVMSVVSALSGLLVNNGSKLLSHQPPSPFKTYQNIRESLTKEQLYNTRYASTVKKPKRETLDRNCLSILLLHVAILIRPSSFLRTKSICSSGLFLTHPLIFIHNNSFINLPQLQFIRHL